MEQSEIVLDKIIDTLLQAMWQTEHQVPHFEKTFADCIDPASGRIKTEPSPSTTVAFLHANTCALNDMAKILHRVVDASAQRLKFQFYESLVDKGLITPALCQFTAQYDNNPNSSDISKLPISEEHDYLSASTPLALITPQKTHPCFDYQPEHKSSLFFSPVPVSRHRRPSTSSDSSLWSPHLLESTKEEEDPKQEASYLDSDTPSSQCDTEQTLVDQHSLLSELPLAKPTSHKANLLFKSPLPPLPSRPASQAAHRADSTAVSSPQSTPAALRVHSSCDNLRDTPVTRHRGQPSLTYKRSSTLLRPDSGPTPGYLAPTISSRLSSRDSINLSDELLAQERDRQRRITMTSLGMYRTNNNPHYSRPSSSLSNHSTKQFIFSDAGTKILSNPSSSSRVASMGGISDFPGKHLRTRPTSTIFRDSDYF